MRYFNYNFIVDTHVTNILKEKYPVPQPLEWTEISSDILWVRLPLPMSLDHINVYLVKDSGGWALIDTGLYTDATINCWTAILDKLDGPLTKVIATHMHPDHIGCLGYLTELFHIPLYMSQTDYFASRALYNGSQGACIWGDQQYYSRAGFSSEQVDKFTQSSNGFKSVVSPIPLNFIRLKGGETLLIGTNDWLLMEGNGHSPEHISLYCKELDMLISGDHVLPEITPNIGSYSTQPESNPLAAYLESLVPFCHLSEETIVLPSHRHPFLNPRKRVEEIISHHQKHLTDLIEASRQGITIKEALPLLFKRNLDGQGMFFAVAEAYAHLNYLMYTKKIIRILRNDVYIYQAV